MKKSSLSISLLLCLSCFLTIAKCDEPAEEVTVCQLKKDPSAYNHKLIKVTGFVSHDFEDFTIFDPTCESWPGVWLEYGGKRSSPTMYCCGVTPSAHRPKEFKVEGIPVPLQDDKRFQEFNRLIQPPYRSGEFGSVVNATLVGRFFSGRLIHYPAGTFWGGFGHMGCCSLLAIQEVDSVSPQDRDDLDYGASADQPDVDKIGCGYRILTSLEPGGDLIKAQQEADLGGRNWAFEDPVRIAVEALAVVTRTDEASIKGIKQTRVAPGRFTYEWRPSGRSETYLLVVGRPYWLSFYARDARRVAWVLLAGYVSTCGPNNSVIRLK